MIWRVLLSRFGFLYLVGVVESEISKFLNLMDVVLLGVGVWGILGRFWMVEYDGGGVCEEFEV